MSIALAFEEREQPQQSVSRLALDFIRIASRPVIKAFAAPNADITASDHVLEIRRWDASV